MTTAPKRIGVAIALLLLAGLVLAAATALAHAGAAPHGSFAAPPRRPGEHGSYAVTAVPATDTFVGMERHRVFETQAEVPAYAADGQAYTSLPLREAWLVTDRDGGVQERWRVAFDAGSEPASAEVLVGRNAWSGLHCTPGLLGCATVSIAENALYRIDTDHSRTVYGQDGGLCGLRNAAQGSRVDLDDAVRFLGDCATPRLRAIRATTLPGHDRVVVFSGQADGRVSQVWLSADAPYPLRVWHGWANGTGTAYTLTSLERGASPPSAPTQAAALPMPGARPRTPLGASTDGFAMAWPLQDAVEAARALAGSPLASYVGQHPEAEMAAASFSEVTNGHWRQRTWTVQYASSEPRGFHIRLAQSEEGEPAATSPFYSTDPSAAVDGEFTLEAFAADADLAPLAALPAGLPAVADVARIYARVRPSADPAWDPNGWAFSVTCPTPCTSPSEAVVWVAAGRTRVFSDQVGATQRFGVPEVQPTIESHVRMVGASPDALAFIEHVDQVRSPYTDPPRQDPASSQEWVLASAARDYAWDEPGPLLAAGTGIALAIAALVLLADALRHGGAGLFSRIATVALPEHPVRASLIAAVDASPGVHFSELARRLDVAPGVAQHHLAKLTAAGLVRAVRAGGRTRYFPNGVTERQTVQAQAFGTPGAAEVLAAVRKRPGMSVSQLATATGRSAGTISHHLARLQASGLVDRRREGRSVGVYPLDETAPRAF